MAGFTTTRLDGLPTIRQPRPVTVDIFIRSYAPDFPWLNYALRSVQKFATGFRDVVVVIPDTDDLPNLTVEKVIKVKDVMPGYRQQQASKLYADTFSDADAFLYVDSDCVFTEPVTPETFMTAGRPNWLHTPFDKVSPDARAAWYEVMRKCLGEAPQHELMRRHPQLIPRWALQEFRGFVAKRHGVSLEHYIKSQPGKEFSEFNTCGHYLWLYHHEKINWINTEEFLPPAVLRQWWSHGGITPEIREEMERLLA